MAIQNRRGAYSDFDPTKLLAGEWAVVQSGDPNSERGRAVYMAFDAGTVERMATYEDMVENVDSATADVQATLTQGINTAINNANTAVSGMQSNVNQFLSDSGDVIDGLETDVQTAISNANSRITAIENAYDTLTDNDETRISALETRIDDVINEDITNAIGNANQAADNANNAAQEAQAIIDAGSAVTTFNGRAGAVLPEAGDYSAGQITFGSGSVADALTFDTTPTSGSTNAITSGGIYSILGSIKFKNFVIAGAATRTLNLGGGSFYCLIINSNSSNSKELVLASTTAAGVVTLAEIGDAPGLTVTKDTNTITITTTASAVITVITMSGTVPT